MAGVQLWKDRLDLPITHPAGPMVQLCGVAVAQTPAALSRSAMALE